MENLPKAFIERIKHQYPEQGDALLAALDLEPKTSIHLNGAKSDHVFFQGERVPWFNQGLILDERPSFTLDPFFHAGCYYPQESSSMFVHHIAEILIAHHRDATCLDLCASPGGKSLLLASILNKDGLLISNEISKTRNHILCENISRWSSGNVLVTQSSSDKFSELHDFFDLVLVDAPCSGEGMFRKDHAARNEWNESSATHCSLRQKNILHDIGPSIKEGGYLIYSTCTFAPEENEHQCHELIASGDWESVDIPTSEHWGIQIIHGDGYRAYQFLPHRVQGEGFFVAVFRKKSGGKFGRLHTTKVFRSCHRSESDLVKTMVRNAGNLIVTPDQRIFSSPVSAEQLNSLASKLYFTMPGIELGMVLKGQFIPAHALALSDLLRDDVQSAEVSKEEALSYLRGENISIDFQSGYCLIQYQTHPLGWVKALPNRANNYYPKEYRIRMR
ncbi:MAG: hypothetical protein K1X54_01895 [Flavobacteriales bacterium]|nr:hypothetical protein [Flavobacteriales bacterium]